MAQTRLWTREELILSLNLYLKLPFSKLDSHTPEVIHLAKLIGRTPGSIAMRLSNFISVDPYHQQRGIKGLVNGRRQVEPIWDEFINDRETLLFESEKILAEKEHIPLEAKYRRSLMEISHLKGEDRVREVKTRVNQTIFRDIIIGNYEGKCAITGLDIPDLLLASHIVPWSKNTDERLNPENGICLSPLYDRAFDKGYISINENYEVLVSTRLKKKYKQPYYSNLFSQLEGSKIYLPKSHHPRKDFLKYHINEIFSKD